MIRICVAIAAAALVAASVSGAREQPPEQLSIRLPTAAVAASVRPLGPAAPPWARRLYRRSVRVLVALTDPRTGALVAGERDGWDYVWPRDAAAGALALESAGLHERARQVVSFLDGLDLRSTARFEPDGDRVPGRAAAGDAEGWIAAAATAVRTGTVLPSGSIRPQTQDGSEWRDRQDYGENVTGDLLGNAIASGAPAAEIRSLFRTPRGLVREPGSQELDSAAAWGATVFPQPGLRGSARQTLLAFARRSTPYGIPPIEGWTPGEVWTAPTAWSAWALAELAQARRPGRPADLRAADSLLLELRRAATRYGTLPERVDARTGRPTSTTPLAWSHAFAILALRARYPSR